MSYISATAMPNLRGLLSRYSRHLISIAICAALGIAVALLSANQKQNKTNLENSWALPADDVLTLTSDMDTILAKPLFGGEPVLAAPPIVAVDPDAPVIEDWRLIGIIAEGDEKQIIIMNDTIGKLENAQVGDTLPGGEVLISIAENAIEFRTGDALTSIALFRDIER
jgi:hypothetical protein